MTFAKKMRALRTDRKMSLADVGKRAGVERTTVWKAENGALPRGDTLQKLCLRGLGITKQAREWKELLALWTTERTGQPVAAQALAGFMADRRAKNNREMAAFLRSAQKLPDATWAELEKAVRRPTVLRGLAALNAIYEGDQPTKARRT